MKTAIEETIRVQCTEADLRGASRLRFRPTLEYLFQHNYYNPKAYDFITTWGLLPGVGILLAFGVVDVLGFSQRLETVLVLRTACIIPLCVLWYLRHKPFVVRWVRLLYSLYLWWLGTIVLVIIAVTPQTDPPHRAYIISIPMVIITMFIAKPYWKVALAGTAALCGEYWALWGALGVDPLGFNRELHSAIGVELVLVSSLVIGAVTCYVIESGERREFVTQCLLLQSREQLSAQHHELLDTLSALEQTNQQLEQLMHEQKEILAIAAHDLKNPLAGIKLQAELLSRYYNVMEQQQVQQALTTIESAISRMLSIITTLLHHHAINTGRLTVTLQTCDIAAIAAQAVEEFLPRAQAKHIALLLTSPDCVFVRADPTLCLHVLENLISNSIKFSPPHRNVHIQVFPSNEHHTVAVRDEGPGIHQEDMKKLFGTYQRLSAQPTGGESSTGLGLSIAKRMVEAMGGRIWCESTPGSGATFFVALPAAEKIELSAVAPLTA